MTKPKANKDKGKDPAPSKKKPAPLMHSPNIEWAKNPDWTWSLIAYLTTHPSFCIKLFSDSTADAAKEGRNKAVAKDGKPQQYAVLAKYIFEEDKEHGDSYKSGPARFTTSVETRLRRLKQEYTKHVKTLGSTGAGLDPEDITDGSELANLVEHITAQWPWWKEFYTFWRELPNYNPIGVTSSTPGMDHAANAPALFDQPPSGEADIETVSQELDDGGQESDRDRDQGEVEKEEIDEDEDEDEDAKVVIKHRSSSPLNDLLKKSKGSSIAKGKALGGRNAGLAKANANKGSSGKHKSASEKFSNFRQTEADRMECKRERDHELKMAQERNKRLGYEYKDRNAERERTTRAEELRLQIELARLTAASTVAQPVVNAPFVPQLAQPVINGAFVHQPAVPGHTAGLNETYIAQHNTPVGPLQQGVPGPSAGTGPFPSHSSNATSMQQAPLASFNMQGTSSSAFGTFGQEMKCQEDGMPLINPFDGLVDENGFTHINNETYSS